MKSIKEIYKFPFISDKFHEGVFTKTQWLLDYCEFRENLAVDNSSHINAQQFQSAMGQNNSLLSDRYRGALLGLAIGDALGTTLEFKERPENNIVTDIVGGGPFDLRPGDWTDDTSMALCLTYSLLRRATFNEQDQMDLYVSWWKEGAFSATGKCFDIGKTTRNALQKYLETGEPMAGSTDPHSAGNGSLMRLVPVVLFYASDPAEAFKFAAESSKTTHAAVESVDACRLMTAFLLSALFGNSKEIILSEIYSPYKSYWINNPLTKNIQAIANGDYKNKSRNEIKSTGYVVDSLEAALWAFYHSDSFEEGAILAVNLGGDADTIGAIYGQLAGIYYGETKIPVRWIQKVTYYHVFYLYADELVSYYSGKPIYK